MKTLKFIFILICVSGCAFKSLGISQLDNLIEFQTSTRLDLYHHQKKHLEAQVTGFLKDEQKRSSKARELLDALTLEDLSGFPQIWKEITLEYNRIALAYSRILVHHLTELDQKQQDHFFQKMKDENREIEDRLKDESLKRYEERVEFFLGSINSSQRQFLRQELPRLKERSRQRLQRRQQLHAKLKHILEQLKTSPERLEETYQAFVSYQNETLAAQAPVLEMIQGIARLADSEQKKAFLGKREEALELLELFQKAQY
ncbi:MAG: hypothetical protein ACLGG7_06485 [Bacteriovoracia bacterium]